ncbi:carboxypeptidase-like regulatory domain-containing protein [Myxococcaceae bacterium GXIMD 01537]
MKRWRWGLGLLLVLAALGLLWPEAPWRSSGDGPAGASPVPAVGAASRAGARAEAGAPSAAPRGTLSIRGTTLSLVESPLADVEVLALRVPDVKTPWRVTCEDGPPEERVCAPEPSEFDAILDEIESSEPPEVIRARSRADGRFELSGLRPGLYEVWAEAPHGVGVQRLAAGTEGARFIIREGVLVAGHIADAAEVPQAGVRVVLWSHKRVRQSSQLTSGSGSFSFFRVPRGDYHLLYSKEGFVSQSIEADTYRSSLLLPRPRTLTGKVVREGRGIGGVRVELQLRGELHRVASSGPDGSFSFTELAPGVYVLEVSSEQGRARDVIGLYSEEPREPPVLDLQPCAFLEGQVVDEQSRQPIAGATVGVHDVHHGGFSLHPLFEVLTDARGFYRFKCLGSEPLHLKFSAKGFVARKVVGAGALNAGESRRIDMALAGGAWIEGRVEDPDGNPLAGAVVFLDRKGAGRDESGGAPREELRSDRAWTRAKEDGSFEVDGLSHGTFLLAITASSRFKELVSTVKLPSVGGRYVLQRDMSIWGSIRGSVVDERGQPRPGIRVRAYHPHPGGLRAPVPDVVTDALGMFRLDDLALGPIVVSAGFSTYEDESVIATTQVEVRGEEPVEVRLELREGLLLSVLVVDERGGPVKGVTVDFFKETPDPDERDYLADVTTNAQGRAELRHQPPGDYHAMARGVGWQVSEPVRLGSGGAPVWIVLRRQEGPAGGDDVAQSEP